MRAISLKEDVQRWKTIGDGQFRVRFRVVLSRFFFLFYKFLFAHFVSLLLSLRARARVWLRCFRGVRQWWMKTVGVIIWTSQSRDCRDGASRGARALISQFYILSRTKAVFARFLRIGDFLSWFTSHIAWSPSLTTNAFSLLSPKKYTRRLQTIWKRSSRTRKRKRI